MITRRDFKIEGREFKFRKGLNLPTINQVTDENGKRVYGVGEGIWLPSITTILSSRKEKNEILDKWRTRVGPDQAAKITKQAANRGTYLHKLCETYFRNGNVTISNHLQKENFLKVKGYLDSGITEIFCIEQPLYSLEFGVAGSCDFIGKWINHDQWSQANRAPYHEPIVSDYSLPAVIDFKTSKKAKYEDRINDYFLQGTAYAVMFEELTEIHIPQVVIIVVVEEENRPQICIAKTKDWIQPLKEVIATYKESVHV